MAEVAVKRLDSLKLHGCYYAQPVLRSGIALPLPEQKFC